MNHKYIAIFALAISLAGCSADEASIAIANPAELI